MAVDLTPELERHVIINPEKAGTTFDDELRSALVHAKAADGTTLAKYRADAANEAKVSKRRSATPIEAPLPGSGLPKSVRKAFHTHTEPNDTVAIDIKWRVLPEHQVYEIDIDQHSLLLNAKYREAVLGHRSLDIDDAPLVKSLLLLLLDDHFVGTGSGAKKKREDAAWQAILLSAIRAQSASTDGE